MNGCFDCLSLAVGLGFVVLINASLNLNLILDVNFGRSILRITRPAKPQMSKSTPTTSSASSDFSSYQFRPTLAPGANSGPLMASFERGICLFVRVLPIHKASSLQSKQ